MLERKRSQRKSFERFLGHVYHCGGGRARREISFKNHFTAFAFHG